MIEIVYYAVLCKNYLNKLPNAVCRRGGYISNAMQTPKKRQISNQKRLPLAKGQLLGMRPRLEPVVLSKPP